eukprot:TRINITY_DN2850_c0_g1_i2.p1 TRINITY_DN2850_c0_g1~~TRINITY_DN2850_c0_g1_i2.p1  ORF type:complete len:577 (-),score=203.27 TRINITY_DN2850_c0_g1_i2:77-1555(-)
MSAPKQSKTPIGVQAYLDQHGISKELLDLCNALVEEKPDNAVAWMATHLTNRVNAKAAITRVKGREVLDSRGNPTVEVDVYANINGTEQLVARSAAPSGASTGSNEALELRDGDKDRYLGKGTQKAVANVSSMISPAIKDKPLDDLTALDKALCEADGTELKTKIGGNALTATSFALAEAGARVSNLELWEHLSNNFHGDKKPEKYSLPTPLVNILNGGKHAGGKLKIQEFMIMPKSGIPFTEALRNVATVYHHLGKHLVSKYGLSAKNLGDEGGYAPQLKDAKEALDAITTAVENAGLTVGIDGDIRFALDCAASEFYDNDKGKYEISDGKFITSEELVAYYEKLVADYPALVSIEDGFDEKDYDGWKKFTEKMGDKIMIVGDDLYTTNTNLIKRGQEEKWANSLLLKVNQIGTISESMEAARMMYATDSAVIVSHRSGETPGSLISDLAVGIGAGYIKTGATARGERISKYNRLLQIEETLKERGLLKEN